MIEEDNAAYVPCSHCEGDGCIGPNPAEDQCRRCGGTGCEPMRAAYTQRIEVGAYYTDGRDLWEVVAVYALGTVMLRDDRSKTVLTLGIDSFRRQFWLARERRNQASDRRASASPGADDRARRKEAP